MISQNSFPLQTDELNPLFLSVLIKQKFVSFKILRSVKCKFAEYVMIAAVASESELL